MAEETVSCVVSPDEPAQLADRASAAGQEATEVAMEVNMTVARAGAKAPEFQGMAYYDGGFKSVKLSDYAGKWTVICFYPGDFTFV